MQKTIVSFLLLISISLSSFASEKMTPRRVLVLPGLSLDWPLGLGVAHGLVKGGWVPDVVISSCGTHFVNMILQAFSSVEAQREFVLSQASFETFAAVKVNPLLTIAQGLRLRRDVNLSLEKQIIPNLFGFLILDVPLNLRHQDLEVPFRSERLQSIMVGARTLFSNEQIGKPRAGQKLVRMVYYSDRNTLAQLENYVPAVSQLPDSSVDTQFDREHEWNLLQATRAGISDPYLIQPMTVGDKQYISGAADLYPIELAEHLAEGSESTEIVSLYGAPFGGDENRFFRSAYGYDAAKRRADVRAKEDIGYIDLENYKDEIAPAIFFPKANWKISFTAPAVTITVPDNIQKFREMVTGQLEYGEKKARDFLKSRRHRDMLQ